MLQGQHYSHTKAKSTDTSRKGSYRPIFLMNVDAELLKRMPENRTPQHMNRVLGDDQVDWSLGYRVVRRTKIRNATPTLTEWRIKIMWLTKWTFGSQPTLYFWDKPHCLSCKISLICYLDPFANILLMIAASVFMRDISVCSFISSWCLCQFLISWIWFQKLNWKRSSTPFSFLKDLVRSWCYFSLKCLVELVHEAFLAYALFGGRF